MSQSTINFFVVEDEVSSRKALVELLNQDDMVRVVGEAGSVNEAYVGILKTQPDALFLDIQLHEGKAYDLLERLKNQNVPIPPIILITGHLNFEYPRLAINKYSDHVVKFMTKPYLAGWDKNFQECKDTILARMAKRKPASPAPAPQNGKSDNNAVLVKIGSETHRLPHDDILLLEVPGEGKTIYMTKNARNFIAQKTLATCLQALPDYFLRVSRQCAVNTQKIDRIDHNERALYLHGHDRYVGIGDRFYGELMKYLKG